MDSDFENIHVKGARVNNLKNVEVTIPRDKLTVITGPSGSGKSSLAFDTIYAEGQRRYVESLSAYARQFLEQLGKPDVDLIEGLSPTISIEQRTTSYNPRSTVGTVTEVWDYLRLLFARISKPYCYNCGKPIRSQSPQQIVDQILTLPKGTKASILAPIIRGRKGEYQKELGQLRAKGFVRVRIDGEVFDLSDEIKLDRNKKHDIEVYVDRIIFKEEPGSKSPAAQKLMTRVSDSVELALKLGDRLLLLETDDGTSKETSLFSERFSCPDCNISYPSPEPRTFSFNSPMGACLECDGLGILQEEEASEEDEDESSTDPDRKALLATIQHDVAVCPECHGARLKPESLAYKLVDRNISDLALLSISDLQIFMNAIQLTAREKAIAERIMKEIIDRLQFLLDVGVNYLSLSRAASSLSGGEAQRIRLATQIGSSLVGVIYVLDEPSIGLHQRDNDRLLQTLTKLRDLGNTVLVVEHDRETMEKADFVVDIGPGAGRLGGEIIAVGDLNDIKKNKNSLTGRYLRGELEIAVPKVRRKADPKRMIEIIGAADHNLKDVSVKIPLGNLIYVTGVSGSGKSTLVIDTLYQKLAESLYRVKTKKLKLKSLTGVDHIDKVIDIDQSPIGKTPRSNPATYTGLFTLVRDLFSSLPESQVRGYTPGRFSFNVKGGRCEACEGDGVTRIEMHFLPDVFVGCEVCKGRRYNRDTLDIRYKGKSIADVLEMSCADALEFFDALPSIKVKLKIINDVGLGYLKIGQSATTLSGGEAQRMKLAKELSRRGTGKTLYILDEPSTGLHFDDIKRLVDILHQLTDQGNTVLVIEHNLDMIKTADLIIDLGPEGGAAGGQIIAYGTPEEVVKTKASITGKYLKPYLDGSHSLKQ